MKIGSIKSRIKPHGGCTSVLLAKPQFVHRHALQHDCQVQPILSRRPVVAAAANEQDSQSSSTSSMPRLPPRDSKPPQPARPADSDAVSPSGAASPADRPAGPPEAPTEDATSSNLSGDGSSVQRRRSSSRRLGGSPGSPKLPPPESQSVMQEKALAGLLAYVGLMGTMATAVSFFVPGIDLFGKFHLDAADMSLALKLMLPVYAMNVLILLPNYSTWKLPEVTPESQREMAEEIAKWSAKKAAQGASGSSAATGSNTSSSTGGSTAAAAAPAAGGASETGRSAAGSSTDSAPAHASAGGAAAAPVQAAEASSSLNSSSSSSQPLAAAAGLDADSSSSTSTSASSSGDTSGNVQAGDAGWLSQQLSTPAISRARDALFLAQGHYLSLNPAIVLHPALGTVVLLADVLAAELLYRSVALQLAGGWLGDRMFEAGAEDFVNLAMAGLPVLPTHMAGQLAAVLLLSGAWGVAVLHNMQRVARRPQLMLGMRGKQAAGQLLQDLSERKRPQHNQEQQQQQQQQPPLDSEQGGSSSGDMVSTAQAPPKQGDSKQEPQQQQQQSPSRAAADLAVAAAAKAAGQQQQQGSMQQPASRRLPGTLNALVLSQLVQGVRDISQMTALGLGFVLTGNLAAPFAAAVVNQALMTVLQKHGVERARQRSIAMARHLAGLTRQLRDIQRRQDAKKQQELQEQQQQQLAATADAAPAAPQESGHDAAAAPRSSASSDSDAQTAPSGYIPAAAATIVGEPAASDTGAGSVQAAVGDPVVLAAVGDTAGGPAAAEPAGKVIMSSRMHQTMSLLDVLLGQMGEHATAGPGSGK